MKEFTIKAALVLVGIIIVLTLPFSFYVVGPNEYAAVFKFGKIVSVTIFPRNCICTTFHALELSRRTRNL